MQVGKRGLGNAKKVYKAPAGRTVSGSSRGSSNASPRYVEPEAPLPPEEGGGEGTGEGTGEGGTP